MAWWEIPALQGAPLDSGRSHPQWVEADAKPTSDAVERPRPPQQDEVWNGTAWEFPLDSIRQRQIARIKQLRDAGQFAPLTVTQGQLQVDEESRARIVERVQSGLAATWIMMDNSSKAVTLAAMKTWLTAIANRDQRMVDRYRDLRTQILAADRTRLAGLATEIEGGWV